MHRIAFVLAATAVTACAPPPQTPRPPDEVPAPADGARTVHATGAYTLRIPAGVRQVPVQGIDSAVDQFEGPSFAIMLDYGMYSCGVPDSQAGQTP